jgi:aspartate 1-decarboxylase
MLEFGVCLAEIEIMENPAQRLHHLVAGAIGIACIFTAPHSAAAGKASRMPDISPAVAYVSVATGKLHAVTVTQANLNYMGSVTIDADLLDAAGFTPHMIVQITNNSNGAFWETYIIEGARGSGIISLNGAPARLFAPGDKAFIVSHALVPQSKLREHWMRTVFVDDKNKVTKILRQSDRGEEEIH